MPRPATTAVATVPAPERDLPRGAAHVERAHCPADRLNRPDREHPAEQETGHRPDHPEDRPLDEERGPHHRPGRAERPGDPDLLAPAHHVGGDRVVDEERPHEDRGVAHHPQVPAERPEHPAIVVGPGPRGENGGGGREMRDEPIRPVESVAGRGVHVNAIEPSHPGEEPLGEGDVDEEEGARANSRGLDDSLHLEVHPAVAGGDGKRVAGGDPERSGHPHGGNVGELGDVGARPASGLPEGRVADEIEAEDRDLLAGARGGARTPRFAARTRGAPRGARGRRRPLPGCLRPG